jgi:hypothetical protein
MTPLYLVLFAWALCTAPYSSAQEPGQRFILITTLYNEKNLQRAQEYITCLERNLTMGLIEKIHILYDTHKDSSDMKENKLLLYLLSLPQNSIVLSKISRRPTFELCFALANQVYPDKKIIIANADIFFNQTLYTLSDYNFENKFLALTRWDVTQNNKLVFFEEPSSQDAWFFKTPLAPFRKSYYELGMMRCDNCIAYQAREAGLIVGNPSLTVQACHMHLSNIRNYPNYMPLDPMLHLPYTTLEEFNSTDAHI